MRFQRRRRPHSAVEASSLSDILFFLMLFFLMISTLASPNAIKLLLPNATTTQHTPPKRKIIVSIDAAGQYYIEKQPVMIDGLQAQLEQMIGNDKETSIVLKADQTATMQEVIKVVDIANQINVPLVVATQHPK